jgi:hypothetical protein
VVQTVGGRRRPPAPALASLTVNVVRWEIEQPALRVVGGGWMVDGGERAEDSGVPQLGELMLNKVQHTLLSGYSVELKYLRLREKP